MAIKVLWHWGTLGPYHFARMNAVGAQQGIDLTVVEDNATDDHLWVEKAAPGPSGCGH